LYFTEYIQLKNVYIRLYRVKRSKYDTSRNSIRQAKPLSPV